MLRQPRAILTALLLLIAGTLSIGGPIAVHHLTAHHAPSEHAACQGHGAENQGHTLPTDSPFPDDGSGECPDCDLLTTLAVADTTAIAAVVEINPGTIEPILPLAAPQATADRAPRSIRGPPAA